LERYKVISRSRYTHKRNTHNKPVINVVKKINKSVHTNQDIYNIQDRQGEGEGEREGEGEGEREREREGEGERILESVKSSIENERKEKEKELDMIVIFDN
jgi:hypothetical protein